jgi:alpha-L-rhamnosidase
LIQPVIRYGLTWATTSYESINGTIATCWRSNGQRLSLEVSIPVNTLATIVVPAKDAANIKVDGKTVADADGVRFLRQEIGKVLFEVGSGNYHFTSKI